MYSVAVRFRKHVDSQFSIDYSLIAQYSNFPSNLVEAPGVCYDGRRAVAIAARGQKVRVYTIDYTSNTWSLSSELPNPLSPNYAYLSVHFIADDPSLLAVRFYDTSTYKWMMQIWRQDSGVWSQLAVVETDSPGLSPYACNSRVLSDGSILLAVGGRKGLKFYKLDLTTNSFSEIGDATAPQNGLTIHDVYWIRFSPDGSKIGIANLAGSYTVYNLPQQLR
jgi:Tol biopolymer transport system component